MQQRTLSGNRRDEFKTNASRRLRRNGKIPAIIYGHQAPMAIAIDAHEFQTKFKVISENVIIKLTVDGKTYDVLVKDFQECLIKDEITHVDFYEIEKGKLLKTHVPVHTDGAAKGVMVGGMFELLMHEIEVECLPRDLPEEIRIDISDLDVGNSIHVSDLVVQDGVKILNPGTQVICHVTRRRETLEEEEEEEEEGVEEEAAAAEE